MHAAVDLCPLSRYMLMYKSCRSKFVLVDTLQHQI
jgi:hypothetical protein